MQQPIHRMRAALALLAFAVIAVIAGCFALVSTAPAITAPLATVAIVALTAAVIIVNAIKRHDETYFQAALNLLSIAVAAILQAVGIAQFTHAIAGMSTDNRPKIYGHQMTDRGRLFHRRAHGSEKRTMPETLRAPLKV